MNPRISVLTLLLALTAPLTAQTAPFGKGCRFGTSNCVSMNWGGSASSSFNPGANQWVYVRFNAPSSPVSGFELDLRTNDGSAVRIATELRGSNGSIPGGLRPGSVIATGTEVFVDGTLRPCRTWFANRSLTPGGVYFIGYRCAPSTGVRFGTLSGGTNVPWWTRPVGSTSLSDLVNETDRPIRFRVLCGGGTPNVFAATAPSIGSTFVWGVDDIPTLGSPSAWFYGLNNSSANWFGSSHALPWDMTSFLMPQCDLLTEPTVYGFGTNIQPAGSGPESRTSIDIPHNPHLIGLQFYGQWAIHAPGANGRDWVMSNGLSIRIQ
jgi:hypothetical protein